MHPARALLLLVTCACDPRPSAPAVRHDPAAPRDATASAPISAEDSSATTGSIAANVPGGAPAPRGVRLTDIPWQAAEQALQPDAIVVIPIGAAAKEHGPHLPLGNDFLLAERLAERVLAGADVVLAPTLNYHFYPAFVAYPGSTTLALETARDVLADICRSLARHGPRRFYALNTGVSTLRALGPTAELLAAEGIVLTYTDLLAALAPVEAEVLQQEGGTHADEAETSMMLYLQPEVVDMRRAVKDYQPKGAPGFTRDPNTPGTYSPTGTWGDPTLATRAKGERLVAALVAAMLRDIEALRARPLPTIAPRP